MTRIVICGGPRTGKTTAATRVAGDLYGCGVDDVQCRATDDLIHLGWSEASQAAALWLDEPGPWIIEGVALARALRKWKDAHPGEPPPVDRVIRLTEPRVPLQSGQIAMMKGEHTVWSHDVEPWLRSHGVSIEHGVPRAA